MTPRGPVPPKPLGDAAFYGLAGEIVREIEPHSEADPAAIMGQFLAAVGSAVGRGPGFTVEADRHRCNLFVAIVGDTASARKGSSWGQAKRLVEAADPSWGDRIVTGASSGEGLIWEVRDDTGTDGGVVDKRLLVIEPELASVLDRMRRDGNTLSAVLRQAWDGGKLDTLVKNNRATATDAHAGLIGHITVEELRPKLSATEQANGFANRFIWLYARRSKELPFGGEPESVEWDPYVKRLRDALRSGSAAGSLDMDSEARALWKEEYAQLSAGRVGRLGAVTARGPAQVRRLAVIYALLDGASGSTPIVTAGHLRAALTLWKYSCESAAFIFGDALGDPTADRVLADLRDAAPAGRSREELRRLFGGHAIAAKLDRVLPNLEERGLIRKERQATEGRAKTVYYSAESGISAEGPGSRALSAHTTLSAPGEGR